MQNFLTIQIQNSARNLISSQNNEDEKVTAAMRWNNNFRKHTCTARFKVGAKKMFDVKKSEGSEFNLSNAKTDTKLIDLNNSSSREKIVENRRCPDKRGETNAPITQINNAVL